MVNATAVVTTFCEHRIITIRGAVPIRMWILCLVGLSQHESSNYHLPLSTATEPLMCGEVIRVDVRLRHIGCKVCSNPKHLAGAFPATLGIETRLTYLSNVVRSRSMKCKMLIDISGAKSLRSRIYLQRSQSRKRITP